MLIKVDKFLNQALILEFPRLLNVARWLANSFR